MEVRHTGTFSVKRRDLDRWRGHFIPRIKGRTFRRHSLLLDYVLSTERSTVRVKFPCYIFIDNNKRVNRRLLSLQSPNPFYYIHFMKCITDRGLLVRHSSVIIITSISVHVMFLLLRFIFTYFVFLCFSRVDVVSSFSVDEGRSLLSQSKGSKWLLLLVNSRNNYV